MIYILGPDINPVIVAVTGGFTALGATWLLSRMTG